jgi:hypothetical protein
MDELTEKSISDLETALCRATQMIFPDKFPDQTCPTDLLQACLARDGDHAVITFLSYHVVATVKAIAANTGKSCDVVIEVSTGRFIGALELPFAP